MVEGLGCRVLEVSRERAVCATGLTNCKLHELPFRLSASTCCGSQSPTQPVPKPCDLHPKTPHANTIPKPSTANPKL